MQTQTQSREQIKQAVKDNAAGVRAIVQALYDKPEIGGEEYYAHEIMTAWLEENGFAVTRNLVMPTGYLAAYGEPNSGLVIAFPAEYDALPEVGHGCAHNLFGGISMLAAKAMQSVVDALGGQVLVIGTPAEENFGGKIKMVEGGVFDNVNAALMIHGSNKNGLGGASLALNPVRFEFHGKNAHGCRAYEGASALDAAVLTFTAINFQRQFLKENCYIHGVISQGGTAANVIPAYASLDYYFRAPKMTTALAMTAEAAKRAEAAAAACGCTVEKSIYECPYGETLLNEKLAELLAVEYEQLGLTEVEPLVLVPQGSTDVGAVSFVCPTIQAYIKIAGADVVGHSKEMAEATVSPAGHKALADGATALALVAAKLIHEPALMQACQVEFEQKKALAAQA
ncbi:MAG: M20 family metallopeptidase [Saccharofermentanales bacterium]|jgi:amidohydrolase|nr:M20 family metallopeptidase [Bacillota bacterium]NLB08355.1 M20 family metallopeptidase [Clostridiales bacterium]